MPERPDIPLPTREPVGARIVLRDGAHQWSFAFTGADVDLVLDHVATLVRDPDAPLDATAGRVLVAEILRLLPLLNFPHSRSENADLHSETGPPAAPRGDRSADRG